jgi:hypothetical protein
MRGWARLAGGVFAAVGTMFLVIVAAVLWKTDPVALSRAEVEKFVSGLNEAAAIGVPHGDLMTVKDRKANLSLLLKVENGEELDLSESATYRRLFQKMLQENQAFLSRFDGELTVIDDLAPGIGNNCFGNGVAGRHDHHDVSARSNFAGLLASLANMERAASSIARIRHASAAYKDLVDLISHLGVAPHTMSIPYAPPDEPWPDASLGENFEDMLRFYKGAQFLPVNSKDYWQVIGKAEASYVVLILAVQSRIMAVTGPYERRISGRFLSPQTLAPPVDLDRPVRPHVMESNL